jgi:hypothetical protein
MATTLSEEEENSIRMSFLLTGVSPCAIRVFFDKIFPPLHLPSMIKKEHCILDDLKYRRSITNDQWSILFPEHGKEPSVLYKYPSGALESILEF